MENERRQRVVVPENTPSVLRALAAAVGAAEMAAAEPVRPLVGNDLSATLAHVGRLRSAVDRVEAALIGEVVSRGVAEAEGTSVVDWVVRAEGQQAPRPDARQVSRAVAVARAMEVDQPGAEVVREAFCAGALPLSQAAVVAGFVRDVHRVVDQAELADAVRVLVDAGSDGPEGRALTLAELSQAVRFTAQLMKPARELESDDERMRHARALWTSPGPAGMTSYRLLLDPEGAAVVDAAVAAGSRPVPGPTGDPDLRPAAARRADALVEVIRRGSAVDGDGAPSPKAQVVVTVPLEHLRETVRGAGLAATGQLLSPSTVRKIACDGLVIPAVLGSQGEILDLGRSQRLFTASQRRAIVVRDRRCTFPGCTRPPAWCDVHHVEHWSRGGGTDLLNAALLCARHHTLVHQRDLTARVDPTGVTWHV